MSEREKWILSRISELANMPIDNLRALYPESFYTQAETVQFCKDHKLSRGYLIREIMKSELKGISE